MAYSFSNEKDDNAVASCLDDIKSIRFREGKIRTSVLRIISDGIKDKTSITSGTVLINKAYLAELNSTNIDLVLIPRLTDLVTVDEPVLVNGVPIAFIGGDFSNQRIVIDPENSNWVPLSRVGTMNGNIFIPSEYIANKIHESESADRAMFKSRDELKATLLSALKGDTVDWYAHLCFAHFEDIGSPDRARRTYEDRAFNIKLEIFNNKEKINPFTLKKGNVIAYIDRERRPKFVILEHDPITFKDNEIIVCKFKVISPNNDYKFSQAVNGFTVFSNTFDNSWEGIVFNDIESLNEEYKKLGDRIKSISRRIKDGILVALGWK